ncbi:hypothetical protein ACU686_35910 [Yinghuangia aomiensis]
MRETIGDVDILARRRILRPLHGRLVDLPHTAEVIGHGDKKTSIRTDQGLQVDLGVLPPESWGAGLQYFTGSKAHNIRTRELAVRAKLEAAGVRPVRSRKRQNAGLRTEEEVYARLGLPWIPPPLREDRGEIEAAQRGELPDLVTEADIRGDLHTHTNLTDGLSSLEDMLAAAHAAATPTTPSPTTPRPRHAAHDHREDARATRASPNSKASTARCASCTAPNSTSPRTAASTGPTTSWRLRHLRRVDPSHFNQNRADITKRLIRACENPHVAIIGHPTTRRIGKRPGIDADWDAVFDACARTGTALEINSTRSASTCATRTSCAPSATA